MNLRELVQSYSSSPATATPATDCRLTVAKVATVAVANEHIETNKLSERWLWFISLARIHGIQPQVVGAEFLSEVDRLDVVEPSAHSDDLLIACMATICRDPRVRQRQLEYEAGRWSAESTLDMAQEMP